MSFRMGPPVAPSSVMTCIVWNETVGNLQFKPLVKSLKWPQHDLHP